MKRISTIVATICIISAALFVVLQASPFERGVWATWQGKTIQVRGDGVWLNTGSEYADVEAHGHHIRIAQSTVTINGKRTLVRPFRKVLVEVTPGRVSVFIDGKPLSAASGQASQRASVESP